MLLPNKWPKGHLHEQAWLWVGPATEDEREFFWSEVQRHQCRLLEHLNDAIIGLVYDRGVPVIVYDEQEARKIWRSKWQVADTKLQADALQRHEQQVHLMLTFDMGTTTPWFRLP